MTGSEKEFSPIGGGGGPTAQDAGAAASSAMSGAGAGMGALMGGAKNMGVKSLGL